MKGGGKGKKKRGGGKQSGSLDLFLSRMRCGKKKRKRGGKGLKEE